MKINKKSSNKYDVTFSIVLNMIIKCLRRDGINRNSFRIRNKRKVLSTFNLLDEVPELKVGLFNELNFIITSYILMKTIIESKTL